MSLALLFPGQGAQRAGMLHTLPDTPAARSVLTESSQILEEFGIVDVDSPETLPDTVATQLALVIAGVACGRSLLDDSGLTAAFVAGHSVGAFAAAVVAHVLTLGEALTAVHLRGTAMRAACAGRDWGMAAVVGLTPTACGRLAAQCSTTREPLWVANVNSGTQTVLAGTETGLDAAAQAARHAGARAFDRLDVRVASHGPVQAGTAETLRAHLATVPRRDPALRYITNSGGRSVCSAQAVLDDLASSVARPVRWYDGVRLMAELGVSAAIETTPGHTLTRLTGAIAPTIAAVALDDTGLAATVARAHLSGSRANGNPPSW
ncbi:acyltransferase domain-containing protein [Mycolicibacterium sp. CH28]|uniref:ACP S-malonyltransferase n=1 Tax=Mycolicibacterium sp. CH28 TaxID=2512237 RepID=UPI001081027C|nr:acyltransferase domain-containing protein [Mycolicibacterium sp. CH28]TGD86725.1 acyltransferase domain-containing protein [Mycolicibacterium sp. CH28]